MARAFLIAGVILSCLGFLRPANALAQSNAPAGRGLRSQPGFQSRAEIAALPPSGAVNTARVGFTPSAWGSGSTARLSTAASAATQLGVYPYPTKNEPRVAIQVNDWAPRAVANPQPPPQWSIGTNSTIRSQKTLQQTSFAIAANGIPTQQQLVYQQPVYRLPTLGLGAPPARATPICNCQPINPARAFNRRTTVAYQSPPGTAVGSGLVLPPPNVEEPGQSGASLAVPTQNGQTNYQYPVSSSGQSSALAARRWNPFVTGSGTYAPLIRQNMPVGSYLGQGLVGQPTAYVDGQPVRNLMRYVFP